MSTKEAFISCLLTVDQQSIIVGRLSVDMPVDCRPTVGRRIDRQSADSQSTVDQWKLKYTWSNLPTLFIVQNILSLRNSLFCHRKTFCFIVPYFSCISDATSSTSSFGKITELLNNHTLVYLLVVKFMTMSPHVLFQSILPLALLEVFQLTPQQNGLFFAYTGLTSTVSVDIYLDHNLYR